MTYGHVSLHIQKPKEDNMRKRRLYSLLAGLTAVATLVLMLDFVVVPSISKDVKSPTSTQMVASAPDSPAEGISVHGHWTIEVKNPDGTLAERREFDNALQPGGKESLVKLLARQTSVGGWDIRLYGDPTSEGAFANDSGGRTGGGVIVESTYTGTGSHVFKNGMHPVLTGGLYKL
jgi:hypothetical protein